MGRNSFDIDDRLLLMRAVCQKDKKALAALYLKYARQVGSYIASYVSCVADIEDLVQDVFLHVCRGRAHYDSSKGVKPYILGIARNVIRRYQKQTKTLPRTMPADSMNGLSLNHHIRASIDPVRRISAKQWKRILVRADVDLSIAPREAIELRFIEGLSCEEAAKRVGCSKWAFYKRLERAKKLLQDALKDGL